jgi:hypothetical protein
MVAQVDFLTNQSRWKNGVFGLAFPLDFHQSDYRKSRSDGGKTGCQENDFWQKIKNNRL